MKVQLDRHLAKLNRKFHELEKQAQAAHDAEKEKERRQFLYWRILGIRTRIASLQGYLELIEGKIINLEEEYDQYREEILKVISVARKELSDMLKDEYSAGFDEQYKHLSPDLHLQDNWFVRLKATLRETMEAFLRSLVEIMVNEDTFFPGKKTLSFSI